MHLVLLRSRLKKEFYSGWGGGGRTGVSEAKVEVKSSRSRWPGDSVIEHCWLYQLRSGSQYSNNNGVAAVLTWLSLSLSGSPLRRVN